MHEDPETLAAIDEGMRDAKAGRIVPAEEVRRCLSELHAYQNALVCNELEEMKRGRVVSHEEVVKRLKGSGRTRRSSSRLSSQ